jgi:long-chain acyl-CoA synthetase
MRPTIVFEQQTLAPDAFEQRWRQSAAALQHVGVRDGDVVALFMRNSPEAVELMLAVRHLGAQWCPINWHFLAEELQYVVGNSGARVLVADDSLLAAQGAACRALQALGVQVFAKSQWCALRSRHAATSAAAAPARGAMFYTSGTTGRPKGIVREAMSPQQVVAAADMRRCAYGADTDMRALLNAPWYHSAPNSFALGMAQENAKLYIEERFDAERTLALIEQHRISHAYLVPTMYVRLLALPAALRQRYDLRSLRFVSSTGSPCPPQVKRQMIEWWGPVINECYGASELGYMTLLTSEQALRKPGSAGLPMSGVTLKILDENGTEQPIGKPGLIYIHQPATPDFSYVGNHSARQQMESPLPVHRGLKTMGDIGYLDEDGFLFIVDRKADMVISGGVNIYPVEIESQLQCMPGIADCAVFGAPDEEFGEALVAAVQPQPGATLTEDSVRQWLRERLAGYKVPRWVAFHDQLPREDTGKIFKRKLREPYWAGRTRRV